MGVSVVDGSATIPITKRFRERARRTNRLDLRGEGPGRRSRFSCVTRRDLHVARIAGVNIPTNKRVVIALQYIHGIGPRKAQEIIEKVHIPPARRVFELTDAEVLQIRETIDRDYQV